VCRLRKLVLCARCWRERVLLLLRIPLVGIISKFDLSLLLVF
jgi:hypothetical protein